MKLISFSSEKLLRELCVCCIFASLNFCKSVHIGISILRISIEFLYQLYSLSCFSIYARSIL